MPFVRHMHTHASSTGSAAAGVPWRALQRHAVDCPAWTDSAQRLLRADWHLLSLPVRGDLIRILHKLLKRKNRPEAILIETTGLADPAPVAQTFFVDDELKAGSLLFWQPVLFEFGVRQLDLSRNGEGETVLDLHGEVIYATSMAHARMCQA